MKALTPPHKEAADIMVNDKNTKLLVAHIVDTSFLPFSLRCACSSGIGCLESRDDKSRASASAHQQMVKTISLNLEALHSVVSFGVG